MQERPALPWAEAVERTVGHGLQGCVAKSDDLGRDEAFVARAKREPVADRGQAGQAVDLDDETEQIGDGAADLGHLSTTKTGFAGIDTVCEIICSH